MPIAPKIAFAYLLPVIIGALPDPAIRGSRGRVIPCALRVEILTLRRVMGTAAVLEAVVGVGERLCIFGGLV